MNIPQEKEQIEAIFRALAEQLKELNVGLVELVVCGGAALNILGLITRTTRDVDIVAFVERTQTGEPVLRRESPLFRPLTEAAKKVQKDFNLSEDWLNERTISVLTFGWPKGLMERVQTHRYDENLIVHFVGKYDQIHFKLFAAFDSERRSIHLADLLALNPTKEEIEQAAQWVMTRSERDQYKPSLRAFLSQIGFSDVAEQI